MEKPAIKAEPDTESKKEEERCSRVPLTAKEPTKKTVTAECENIGTKAIFEKCNKPRSKRRSIRSSLSLLFKNAVTPPSSSKLKSSQFSNTQKKRSGYRLKKK